MFEGYEVLQTADFDRTQNNTDSTSPLKLTISVSLGALTCKRLIDRGFLPHELLPLIQETIMNEDEIKVMIDSLYGDNAQTFVDVVHEVRRRFFFVSVTQSDPTCHPVLFTFELPPPTAQALGYPDLLPSLRRKCVSTLCRICGRQALLPKSLQIPICYNRSEIPCYRGGYADVWMGNHQGLRVAAKVLRIYSTSDFERVTRVCLLPRLESVY